MFEAAQDSCFLGDIPAVGFKFTGWWCSCSFGRLTGFPQRASATKELVFSEFLVSQTTTTLQRQNIKL
jgi:hypothetical protein